MPISIDYGWLQQFMLAAVRVTLFLVIAPPFAYRGFPARVKAMLAIGLALALSAQFATPAGAAGAGEFITALTLEAVGGAVLGLLVMVVFAAVQSAGNLIDVFGGFQLAQAFDPQAMVNGAQFTRLFQFVALALLFVTGGYQLILAGLARSFTAVPPGGSVEFSDPVALAATLVTELFLAAVQIAGPLLIVLFLADAGLGLLTRVAPALNAFALGFPLKILVTLMLVPIVVVAIPHVIDSLTSDALALLPGAGR
ncbi:flagellar biosynthetic protein FliR [Ruicaihuangia caeni]|uniref:flagellar biosynthetic protein FliR n=1 Tax=Ruicaihuangia caeni TaxID=3042517 RepID=UPI00338E89F6